MSEEKETIMPWTIKYTNIGEDRMDNYRGLREEIRQDLQDLELLNRQYEGVGGFSNAFYYDHLMDRLAKHTKKLKELVEENELIQEAKTEELL